MLDRHKNDSSLFYQIPVVNVETLVLAEIAQFLTARILLHKLH